MPSTDTVTAYYTFVAGTKARASQVNTNFDNHRGHAIPINSDTATSSHQTHDLGSATHEWRKIYLTNPPFVNGAQLGRLPIDILMDGSSPCDMFEDESYITRTSFPYDDTTGVVFQFVVPQEYSTGNPMSISVRGYCETGGSNIALESASALYKSGVTDVSLTVPTNVLTSTANVFVPTTASLLFTSTALRITSASGLINSVTVTSGDVISCYLKRTGNATGDTNTGYFHLTNVFIDLNA